MPSPTENLDELTAGQARREATQDEPEWHERLDSARDEISDAMTAVLGHGRAVVGGKLKSTSPYREMAIELLRSARESIRLAMEEI